MAPRTTRRLAMLLVLSLAGLAGGCDGDDDDTADDDTADDDTADDDSADDDTGPVDADGDGYDSDADCDDGDAAVYPGAEQICDGVVDNDCDGVDDPNEADADADGYSECDGDCNETNVAVHPDAEHVCDDGTLDNDCDGVIDANETDSDLDGYTECQGDCDDADDTVRPDAYDVEDGVDNDCDGEFDEDIIDCATVPTEAVSETLIAGARGHHGLAFDQLGYIVGSDGNSLIRCDYQGQWSVLLPNIGSCEQMTYMPDGDLVVVNNYNGTLTRVNPQGVPSQLAPANGAYGLIWGPDEMLYTAGGTQVHRVDPTTGDTTAVTSIPYGTAHTVAFGRDNAQMFIGTIGGPLFVVDLDEDLEPLGPPQPFAQFGGWHDGVGVDACGYVFVADYSTSALYRVSPGGDVSVFAQWGGNGYGHGLVWGSGIGGWRDDALYVPLPYNNDQVKEVVVGTPPASWGGTVHNAP